MRKRANDGRDEAVGAREAVAQALCAAHAQQPPAGTGLLQTGPRCHLSQVSFLLPFACCLLPITFYLP